MQLTFSNLTNEEQEVFSLYKGNNPFDTEQCFSDYINRSLGVGNILPIQWEDKAKILDSIIAKAHCDVERTVYRATIENYLPRLIEGSDFIYPSYMSTAVDEFAVKKHFAFPFRDITAVLLKINCPEGTPMLDMEINGMFGGLEKELLLPRNSRFNVKSIDCISDKSTMCQTLGIYTKNFSLLKMVMIDYVSIA